MKPEIQVQILESYMLDNKYPALTFLVYRATQVLTRRTILKGSVIPAVFAGQNALAAQVASPTASEIYTAMNNIAEISMRIRGLTDVNKRVVNVLRNVKYTADCCIIMTQRGKIGDKTTFHCTNINCGTDWDKVVAICDEIASAFNLERMPDVGKYIDPIGREYHKLTRAHHNPPDYIYTETKYLHTKEIDKSSRIICRWKDKHPLDSKYAFSTHRSSVMTKGEALELVRKMREKFNIAGVPQKMWNSSFKTGISSYYR